MRINFTCKLLLLWPYLHSVIDLYLDYLVNFDRSVSLAQHSHFKWHFVDTLSADSFFSLPNVEEKQLSLSRINTQKSEDEHSGRIVEEKV